VEAHERHERDPHRHGEHIGQLPNLLTVPALATLLGVKERHVRRLVAERRVPIVKWGHLVRFDPDEIAAWLDSHRRGAEGA
jgi:excisionase family DNA binding protein